MRLERASGFLGKLRMHSKLLNEIALRDLHRVDYAELHLLINSIYGYDETQTSELTSTLTTGDPEPFLTYDEPFFTLENRIAELFRWLSKNVRLQSHHSLNGIVDEIRSQNEKMVEALEGNLEYSKYQIETSMDTIEYRTAELLRISEENSTHISGVIQRFKEGGIDREKRSFLAQVLLSDHLDPMLKLVEPEGPIEVVFQEVKTTLERIETLHAFPILLRENARRGIQKQRRTRERLQQIHQYSFTNFVPILQSFARSTSTLLSGATAGVRFVSTYGWKSITPLSKLQILKPRRPRNILSDSGFTRYNERQNIQNRDNDFIPGATEEYTPTLELEDIQPLLGDQGIEDVLQAVLDLHPNQSLTECSRVTTDFIISVNKHDKLRFRDAKTYVRKNEKLEVNVVEVL
jgi:hypothetical protein